MPNITINVPATYSTDAVAAARAALGDDAEGLTDPQVSKKALLRYVKGLVKAHRRRTATSNVAAVTAADTALANKEAAAATAVQARKDAEVAEGAAVEAAFGSDS